VQILNENVFFINEEIKALCISASSNDYNLHENTDGIIFLATPHRGIIKSTLRTPTVIRLLSAVGLLSYSPLCKELEHNSGMLHQINMQFRQVVAHNRIKICSAFATKPIPELGSVVSEPKLTGVNVSNETSGCG
jgi:hypothetical protein